MITKIIPLEYLDTYLQKQPIKIDKHLNRLRKLPVERKTRESSLIEAAVYSSMIEGNPINLDQYYRFLDMGLTDTKPFREISELIKAYEYATDQELHIVNFLKIHEILSLNLLEKPEYRGSWRKREVGVFSSGQIIYSATPACDVESAMNKLFGDIEMLLNSDLSSSEAFYFASMIHLVFVHIHPFADGNGRAARLLEKWFLANTIGSDAWLIPSERLYQTRLASYHRSINLGVDYEHTNYELSIPFLLLLPMALTM